MASQDLSYSPNILIYIEVGKKKIRLADVLCQSATLYQKADHELPKGTVASLVFHIGNNIERQEVILQNGLTLGDETVLLSTPSEAEYSDFDFPL